MKRSVSARALVILATSASLLGVGLASPASAALKQHAACKKVSEKTVGNKITFYVAMCTPLAATGGSGSGPVTSKPGQTSGTVNVTVKWAKAKGTTKATVKFGPTTPGKCKAGTTRLKITGKVTGGTGAAGRTIKKNEPVTGTVCLN